MKQRSKLGSWFVKNILGRNPFLFKLAVEFRWWNENRIQRKVFKTNKFSLSNIEKEKLGL